MRLFVGLGNPGSRYAGNRHNIGFMAVDAIARAHAAQPWRRRFQGQSADVLVGSEKVVLLKPDTFMNDSGRAVGEAQRFFKLDLADIVVFHDELDLAPAKLRVKSGGGNAGHNGLRSITALCGNEYRRVRMGIGHPGHKDLVHCATSRRTRRRGWRTSCAPSRITPRSSPRPTIRASRTRSISRWRVVAGAKGRRAADG